MDRIQRAVLVLPAFMVAVSAPAAASAPGAASAPRSDGPGPAPVRAVWVVRDALTSPRKIQRVVEDAAAAGVTDLLVQVRGRGDAYYVSRIVPAAPQLAQSWNRHGAFDPLAIVLEHSRPRGIRVHAWLNVYLVKGKASVPADHVTRTHPQWIAVDARGRSMSRVSFERLVAEGTEGVFLSPGSTGAVRHFVAIVEELVSRYPIDGIHLDYCRYPKWGGGYSEPMRLGFQRLTGLDPVDLEHRERELASRLQPHGLLDAKRQWLRFKADQVTALVKAVRETLKENRPAIVLSAAVKPDPEAAYSRFGQDWIRWIREDLVDVVAPMMYSTSTRTVTRQARHLRTLVPPETVWAGISVYNQSLDAAAAKIRSVRAEGIHSISIFSYNSLPGGERGLTRLNQVR